jgi:hypothetical protein
MTDVPESDALEQARTVEELPEPDEVDLDPEVPEADALEQATPVPDDEEYDA